MLELLELVALVEKVEDDVVEACVLVLLELVILVNRVDVVRACALVLLELVVLGN